jgi:hypothetical protein
LCAVEKGQALTTVASLRVADGFKQKKGGTEGYRQSTLRFREEILAFPLIAANAAVQQYLRMHSRYVQNA